MLGSLPSTGGNFPGARGLLLVVGFTCCASLLAGADWTWRAPASAQTMTPGVAQSPGIGATSPFTLGSGPSVPPAGIPLGSTDLAAPGLSPAPPTGVGSILGNSALSGSSNSVQSSGAPFE